MPGFLVRCLSSRLTAATLLVLFAANSSGCRRKTAPPQTKAIGQAPLKLQPLQAANPSVELPLRDAPPTVLQIPLGITTPAPLFIVLGEDQTRLQERCERWHKLSHSRGFTLCQSDFPNTPDVGIRIERASLSLRAAMRATKRRFGAYVTSSNVALLGIALGADVVVALVRNSPDYFSRFALVDGGFSAWTAVDSARIGQLPTSRALLVCSAKSCQLDATRVTATLRASGVPANLLLEVNDGATDGSLPGKFPEGHDDAVARLLSDENKK